MNEELFMEYVRRNKRRKTDLEQRKETFREKRLEIEEITFPKNWQDLTMEEQEEWIKAYFMPRRNDIEKNKSKKDKLEA